VSKVIYVDRLSIEEQRRHYPELDNLPLVVPDIIDDGTMLREIEDGSLDFIIANHLLEHLDNPLLALENWCKKLKPGGVVYMAVPDKRHTFDKERPATPLSHLVEDYKASEEMRAQRNAAHYVETAEIIEGRVGKDAGERVERLIARRYSIHFHAWTFESFVELLSFVTNEMRLPYKIIDYSTPLPGGDEFIFILGKDQGKRRSSRQLGLLGLVQRIADILPGGHQSAEPR
jgi:SAM-dependent methyltransferase